MRVTSRMMFEVAQRQTASARDRSIQAQNEVATGLRVTHPGDDPTAAGVMVTQNVALRRLDTIDKSTAQAATEVQVADGALQGVSNLIARAQQLAVQLGSDSYGAAERAGGAQEIADISAQIGRLMNTQVAGRYIFGGNVDNVAPFDPTGNYLGDTVVRQVEIAPGLLGNASVRGDQVVKGVGVTGGVDVFAVLSTLSTALAANDGSTVRASVDGLNQATNQVAAGLTSAGTMISAFGNAQQIGSVAKDAATKSLSAASEADIFEATSNLMQAQQSLQSALAVSAKTFGLSLLDYLK